MENEHKGILINELIGLKSERYFIISENNKNLM